MLVTMKTNIGGSRNGEPWPAKGGTIDLPDHEATDLITAGYAVPAADVEVPDATEPAADDNPTGTGADDDPTPASDDTAAGADDDPADATPATPTVKRRRAH